MSGMWLEYTYWAYFELCSFVSMSCLGPLNRVIIFFLFGQFISEDNLSMIVGRRNVCWICQLLVSLVLQLISYCILQLCKVIVFLSTGFILWLIRKYCDGIWPFAGQRFCKHILEVTQSTVGPPLLSSRKTNKNRMRQPFEMVTDILAAWKLQKSRNSFVRVIRQTDVVQGSSVCEQWFFVRHSSQWKRRRS
jgi:hypothetical protein